MKMSQNENGIFLNFLMHLFFLWGVRQVEGGFWGFK